MGQNDEVTGILILLGLGYLAWKQVKPAQTAVQTARAGVDYGLLLVSPFYRLIRGATYRTTGTGTYFTPGEE